MFSFSYKILNIIHIRLSQNIIIYDIYINIKKLKNFSNLFINY